MPDSIITIKIYTEDDEDPGPEALEDIREAAFKLASPECRYVVVEWEWEE